MNATSSAIVYWTMMIILYLISVFLMCHFSSFFSQFQINYLSSFLLQFLKQSKNYIRFNLQFQSTTALEITR